MTQTNALPQSLLEATRYFSNPDTCLNFAVSMRWPNGVACPRCGCMEPSFISTRRIWKCKGCKRQFSVKVGTIFEDSPLGLDVWFVAMWLIVNAKNGISSYEVSRALGVTQKTAWFLLHRVRHIMKTGSLDKLEGEIEVDESFVGGLEKNKHKDKKQNAGRGGVGKQIVLGVLERGNTQKDENGKLRKKDERVYSQIRVNIIPDTTQVTLHGEIKANVTEDAEVYTDAHRGYNGLSNDFKHAFVDHAVKYAEGKVYTNGVENFWSLLDRSIHGTYIKPEAQHLLRYVDEQAFRFNYRSGTDATRFLQTMQGIEGKRLTYDKLITSHLKYLMPK